MAKKGGKQSIVPVIILILGLIGLGTFAWWWFNYGQDRMFATSNSDKSSGKTYSKLTGLEITDESLNSSPTFCIQIPNGSTDGARPQVGLSTAGVVFEAIAESGITRFAAIFQDPDVSMIGPIRSLRPYYLEWDTPFNCTIVHDGGSDEALIAINNSKYRNLDEDFDYMWKENYIDGNYRYWNNVFTSPALLNQFNQTHSYTTSDFQAFPRLTPSQVESTLASNTCSETPDCDSANLPSLATTIRTVFSDLRDYNVVYQYDADSNTYLRFNESSSGELISHQNYTCPSSLENPPAGCELQQISPSAIAVIRVQEHTMDDDYHESIQTIGSGKAYIFQNGQIIEGKWSKPNIDTQITFTDVTGSPISFTPGQLWITAVPQFGNVEWE